MEYKGITVEILDKQRVYGWMFEYNGAEYGLTVLKPLTDTTKLDIDAKAKETIDTLLMQAV